LGSRTVRSPAPSYSRPYTRSVLCAVVPCATATPAAGPALNNTTSADNNSAPTLNAITNLNGLGISILPCAKRRSIPHCLVAMSTAQACLASEETPARPPCGCTIAVLRFCLHHISTKMQTCQPRQSLVAFEYPPRICRNLDSSETHAQQGAMPTSSVETRTARRHQWTEHPRVSDLYTLCLCVFVPLWFSSGSRGARVGTPAQRPYNPHCIA